MKYLILILGLCFYIQIQAQQKSESQRPPWMRGDLPIQTNHSYWFKQMVRRRKNIIGSKAKCNIGSIGGFDESKRIHRIRQWSLNRFFQAILTKNIMKRL